MPSLPSSRTFLSLHSLETRDNPSTIIDNFDAARNYFAPSGWNQFADNGSFYYGVSRNAAVSGNQSLAVYGTQGVESRIWNATPTKPDVAVSATIRADTPAPILVFGRGTDLNSRFESMVAVAVGTGGSIELRETRNGSDRIIQKLTPTESASRAWLKVTLELRGNQATVRVQRLDNQQFLASSGRWQAGQASAIQQTITVTTQVGNAGIGRLSGPYGTAYVDDFAVTPLDPQKPDIPRNYSHIRLAQLAYDGTPNDAAMQAQLKDSIDLVIPNSKYLEAIDQTSPDTPQLIYTNLTNLYLGLLTDWLDYSSKNGVSPESAFYHVPQATPFSGSSPSSLPVNWFWDVRLYSNSGISTDLTSNSRGTRSTGVNFGAAGESLAIAYPDRFREINLTNVSAAKGNWAGTWEYAATNAAGQVQWKTLPTLTDSTNGIRSAGQITFDPPSDWKPVSLPGRNESLYYVRFRTTTGTATQAPSAGTVLGREFVSAVTTNGRVSGTIPAFDANADLNKDGYLNDAEWAARRAGFNARFVSESRLFYPNYGQMRYVTNPSSQAFRDWAADYHSRVIDANPLADGFFLDNANGRIPFQGTPVVESTSSYTADSGKLVDAVYREIAPKWVLSNTTGSQTEANVITKVSAGAFEEFSLRPSVVNWAGLNDIATLINSRLNSRDPSDPRPYVVIDSHPGSTSMTDPRTQMGVLSYYYLVGDPDDTFLMFFGGFAPATSWANKFSEAVKYNVGRPTGAMTTFAQGLDPQNAALTYKVFSRTYDNALVLFKPRSYTLGKGTGTTDDATATTHQLGGNYRLLNNDGTLGPVINRITLRNGEGAVLIKA